MVAAAQAEKKIQQPAEAAQEEEHEQASMVCEPSPHPQHAVISQCACLPLGG